MQEIKFEFTYERHTDISSLNEGDAQLLRDARTVSQEAYAPYSKFYVGAVAKLINETSIKGTNQENASYPVGICAERVLLGNAATIYPGVGIDTIAISYYGDQVKSNHPIFPCGMCRQSLLEYELRVKRSIRLILGGQEGEVIILKNAGLLLPLAFTNAAMG